MEQVLNVLQQYWGYSQFRPLQREAISAVLEQRDSVVVLPTGGGKSLCFQVPAMCMAGLAVVVSPLIALMKDQIDGLIECGVPAACINSSLSIEEKRNVAKEIRAGRLKLLYVAPERLCTTQTLSFLKESQVSFFAIDEAHCISSWGHDFRPEYRQLGLLKTEFPNASVHAYTATATKQVREDIARQLHLSEPVFHVGSFDRPNLIYRAISRRSGLDQVQEIMGRHKGESGVIYCIRRADCETLSEALNKLGHRTRPYHAGLSDSDRRANQEAFLKDEIETIVATVAFGMGIDKSNVRYVIHAAAPKSLEAYQQESGRAGRDGLEAECILLYAEQDFMLWRKLMQDQNEDASAASQATLHAMDQFCHGMTCRHRTLVNYFGQEYETENCSACDVCLQELDLVPDPLVTAQKILSCVVRLKQMFGGDYTALVLTGSKEQRIVSNGHDQLSTYGLLKDVGKRNVREWLEQLCSQGFLEREGEFQTLRITPTGWQVLKGQIIPRLLQPVKKTERKASRAETTSWEGVDKHVFEDLRALRRKLADTKGVASFMIFSDAALRDMARRRPTTPDGFRLISGVGEKKLAEYAEAFLDEIKRSCEVHQIETDIRSFPDPQSASPKASNNQQESSPKSVGSTESLAWKRFDEGKSVSVVCAEFSRAASTVNGYLCSYLRTRKIISPVPWVDVEVAAKVRQAADELGLEALRPIFEHLEGKVSFDEIRIVIICLRNQAAVESQ